MNQRIASGNSNYCSAPSLDNIDQQTTQSKTSAAEMQANSFLMSAELLYLYILPSAPIHGPVRRTQPPKSCLCISNPKYVFIRPSPTHTNDMLCHD